MQWLIPLAVVVSITSQQPPATPARDPVAKAASANATITGRVTDAESGRPIGHVIVAAMPLNPFASDGYPAAFQVLTAGDGSYTLSGLPPAE